MTTTGKVQKLARVTFEWKIDNFLSLLEKAYISPSFSVAGASWYLGIYPYGRSENNSFGYIGAYLYRKLNGPPITLSCSLTVKNFKGNKHQDMQFTHVFEKAEGCGSPKFLKRSEVTLKKFELVPSDALALVCDIDYYSKSSDDAGNTVTAKCSHCRKTLDAECVSSHEQNCLDKPMRCPICGSVVALRKLTAHECGTAKIKATEKLVGDLADMLESEKHSDVTIRVKNREFHLHRSILAARNSYFSSMFTTEMKEKTTGIVSIDDCEPDIFKSFISFIYTGKVQTLSCDNVCALYEVADKYQEDQLKAECLCFMKAKLSVDTFCDFIVLALRHDEKDLLQDARNLFCRKIKDIILSVKWQTFVQEYPIQSNELHIKALVNYNVK